MTTTNNLHWSNIDKRVRTTIMIGLALGMLVAILDGTIVATAMPSILDNLGGHDMYSWVITGFMLCETAMIPIAGKLSDQYGRKPIFLVGMAVFLSGSVLCAISGSMTELILFRAIQGLGGGMLVPVATAAVADLYAPTERGKIQGMLGALFAVAMCLGPFLGGFITEHISWHWIFVINLPIGAIALAFTATKFPKQEMQKAKIDYLGMGLLVGFIFTLLLFFTWAGQDFAWISIESFVMIMLAAALLILFIFAETKAREPVIRLSMFRNRTILCCAVTMLIFGIGLMGLMAYLPMFMQIVMNMGATNSGILLLPFVFGVMITAMTSGFTVKRTGYLPWLLVGPVVTAAGMLLLSTLGMGSSSTTLFIYLFFTGLGMGCMMSVIMIAAQNNATDGEMGMVTSTVNLFRSIGSTMAVGVFATLINARMAIELSSSLPPAIYDQVPHNVGILDWLSPENIGDHLMIIPYISDIINSFGESVTFAFMIGAFVVLTVLAVVIFIRGKPRDEVEEENAFTKRVEEE